MRTASLTIHLAGTRIWRTAAPQVIKAAFQPVDDSDPAAVARQLHEQSAVLTAFRDTVLKAKL
jgi:hypothetical protein